ncbi:MAG TPA: type II secretion system F family protein [archaeon]|nr:type II secretion system F family protein [archaeon]
MLSYKGLATSLFGKLVDKYSDVFAGVKEALPKANIRTSFRAYMSTVFLSAIITYVAILAASFIMVQLLPLPPEFTVIFVVFVPLASAFGIFVFLILYPSQRVNSRKNNIEANLPFVLMHMGSIMESGIPPLTIFRLIGEFQEYGEIAYEMKRIVRNMDQFGVDPLSAVRDVAFKSPSNALKQVLLGIVTATESGGDVKTYLKNAGQQALFEWRIKRQRFLEQLSTYAEFYTGLMIAAPLFIVALLAVMNVISPSLGSFKIMDLMMLSTYLIIPSMNLAFLVFLRGVEIEI